MKFWIPAVCAAVLACASCVKVDDEIGGSLVPVSHTYTVVTPDPIEIGVKNKMADSLSGYSSTRITIGAIRKDDEYGLSRHSSALWLVPLVNPGDTIDYGENPIYKGFHFTAIADSFSVENTNQANILQNVYVYGLNRAISFSDDIDGNSLLEHSSERIAKGIPIVNGSDSLAFDFTDDYGKQYMDIQPEDMADLDTYIAKFPGIYLETNDPIGEGGRINIFQLQLGYDKDYNSLTGSFAELFWSGEYDGERIDTNLFFYFGASDIYDVDSLLENSGTGSFPEYALNMTTHDESKSRALAGDAGEYIYVEGGGGLKPVISAVEIRDNIRSTIEANGHDPDKAILNKVSLNFSFIPSDEEYELMYKLPEILSPTCRIVTDTSVTFMGLTDASDSYEDQGDINRSLLKYTPDITYHAQELIQMEDDDEGLLNGNYDIWLLIMHNDVVTTTTSGSSELSEYYKYLAYQSYMSSMYGGYGYGSYGSSYSNYYNYQMLANYYGSSSTSSSTQTVLDRDRYYYCRIYGPDYSDEDLRPVLSFTYSIPNE